MAYLERFLSCRRVCIQCHNNPDADALASAFAAHRYLASRGVDSFIVYGGPQTIKKASIKMLVQECGIPVQRVEEISDFDLLLMVDCQYGAGNAQTFPAERVAIIDHHIRTVEEREDYLIKSDYQSCSTIFWELLEEAGYAVREDEQLTLALLYGLYTDTSCFADLFGERDLAMRSALFDNQPVFDRLAKSSLSVAELLVASDAMYNHYFDVDRRFSVVEALKCDQTVLGVIGDFMIQVDAIYLSFAYTEAGVGYQISLRTCHEALPANEIAAFVCREIGSGGGHARKAGGRILKSKMQEIYGDKSVFDVVNLLLCRYIDEHAAVL